LAFSNIPEKIKIMMFVNLVSKDVLSDDYYKSYKRILAGGYFTGSIQNMKKAVIEFDSEVRYVLSQLRGPLEDVMIGRLIVKNPDLFTYYFGRHNAILSNYHHTVDSLDHNILHIIAGATALAKEDMCYAITAAEQICISIVQYGLIVEPDLLHKLLDNYFTIAYYVKGDVYAKNIVGEYCKHLSNPLFYAEYEKDKERIMANFGFVNFDISNYIKQHLVIV
jgi:hypothetical protein